MSRNFQASSDNIEFAEAMLIEARSSELTLHTAQASQNPFVVPFDGEIKKAWIMVTESPGTAPGTIDIGTSSDEDAFIAGYSVALTDSGYYDITDQLVTADVSQGDIIEFETNGESTTTGKLYMGLVIGSKSVQN